MYKIVLYHVRNLAVIMKSLDLKTTTNAAAAFTTSSLDYRNVLPHGLPKHQIHRIQLVQNAAIRVMMELKKYDHITQARKELHWLPTKTRLKFKIITLTWKALNNMDTAYIKHSKSTKIAEVFLYRERALYWRYPKPNYSRRKTKLVKEYYD